MSHLLRWCSGRKVRSRSGASPAGLPRATNLHANADDPIARGTIDAGLDNHGGNAQFMHPEGSAISQFFQSAGTGAQNRTADLLITQPKVGRSMFEIARMGLPQPAG